jgi:hypothetical protein
VKTVGVFLFAPNTHTIVPTDRGYNECVNAFIEQIQLTSLREKDPFKVSLKGGGGSPFLSTECDGITTIFVYLFIY